VLRIPRDKLDLEIWIKEVTDECMASEPERAISYSRAAQYYYAGTYGQNPSIYNKTKGFIDRLAGFLMQPTDVRFSVLYDTSETDSVLERAQLVSEKLTADYRNSDSDVTFAESVTWSYVNGCHLLKHFPEGDTFRLGPVHPQNFGVLSESILNLDEQEVFVHITYPTMSRLKDVLEEHPHRERILKRIAEATSEKDKEDRSTYFHQMVVGGMSPVGSSGDPPSSASGIVNVFPIPAPWRPRKNIAPTLKHVEMWIKDADRQGDYTTIQFLYPDIILEGDVTRRNLSRVPGHHPFVKIQGAPTPGYFWGRSLIADIQQLQDVLSKRMRDLKILWDRNVAAPMALSGYTSITEEQYLKLLSEGGFINDPNPNAKASPLLQPMPEGYMQEIQFLMELFDEASGFSPVMSGQGDTGVRAGVHAQTLVRTSSPRLIDQAARIERQLAQSGYLSLRIMQAMDPSIYETSDNKIQFILKDLPGDFQVQVDSHSASPAFAEDNRQVAIALARAGAIDAEDLIHMLHPPGAELLLSRLRQRQKKQAQMAQAEKAEQFTRDILHMPDRSQGGGGHKKRGGSAGG
jgi:hypothetical protein